MTASEQASRFLTSLAHALSTMTLYDDGHPAVQRAVETAYEQLFRLQELDSRPMLTFLGREIVFQNRPLGSLKNWDWGERLAAIGVQRLEFDGPATRPDFDVFVEDVFGRLTDQPDTTAQARHSRETVIRYGPIGLKHERTDVDDLVTGTMSFTLGEEAETVRWMHEELRDRGRLAMVEADAIVRSLTVAMHGDRQFVIPLLHLKEFDQYTTTHSLNVSVLSMALAEFIGMSAIDVRRFGIAGLLHDLGKIRIPKDVLNKPGKLEPNERELMNRHPIEGAKILIERESSLDLAAVVAYEHHIRIDGGGYPCCTYDRKCHPASELVHLCDVYDALRTHRPYRDAWPHQKVVSYLKEGAGSEFDPELTNAFVSMLGRWESRILELRSESQVVVAPEALAAPVTT